MAEIKGRGGIQWKTSPINYDLYINAQILKFWK